MERARLFLASGPWHLWGHPLGLALPFISHLTARKAELECRLLREVLPGVSFSPTISLDHMDLSFMTACICVFVLVMV